MKILKTTLAISAVVAMLGCNTTAPPTDTAWVPKAGDWVHTYYCADCPGEVGTDPYSTWLTGARKDASVKGGYTVYAPEFEQGISVVLVTFRPPFPPPPR